MAKTDRIAPFPTDLDRDCFGHWLAGFTDGEGSFVLALVYHGGTYDHHHAVGYFRIKLRHDDLAILETIRSYWGCGNISRFDNRRSKVPNAKPSASFTVACVSDLVSTVIPHFDRYPLYAKKRRDFLIWKQAIGVMAAVQCRPVRSRRSSCAKRLVGTSPKWTDAERERFGSLVVALKDQRRYENGDAPASAAPVSAPVARRTLFGDDD